MQQPVMRAAQQHEVLQARLAAVDPMPDMMRLDITLMRTAGKTAAAAVAQLQCPQQPRRDDPSPAFVVQQVALGILDELRQVRIAGDLAGVLFVDAPVRVDRVAGAFRRLLGELIAVDGEYHLVAPAGAPLTVAGVTRQVVLGHVHERVGIALSGVREFEHQRGQHVVRLGGWITVNIPGCAFRFRGNVAGVVGDRVSHHGAVPVLTISGCRDPPGTVRLLVRNRFRFRRLGDGFGIPLV